MWSCLQPAASGAHARGPACSPLPHLCAGGPSIMMFTHRICMALRGLGRLHTVDRVMRLRAAMLLLGTGDRQPVSACSRRSTQRVGRKVCLCLRAQLEADKVLDVVEDALAFLYCIPRRETRVCVSKRSHRVVSPGATGQLTLAGTPGTHWEVCSFCANPVGDPSQLEPGPHPCSGC